MPIRVRLALAAAALLFWAGPAFGLSVLVAEPRPDDAALYEAFGRLRAELRLQGFEVILMRGDGSPVSTEQLERAARDRDAFAAVALQREEDSTIARIQIVDRVTGKTISRKLKISGTSDGPMLLAIRATDLLKTSLLELGPGERPPDDVVGTGGTAPPGEVVRFSRQHSPFQVRGGGLALWHPELGPSWGGAISVVYRPSARIALGLDVGGPSFGGEFRARGNTASLREELLLARFSYDLGSSEPGARWEWGPVARLGMVHLAASGNVAPPLVSRNSQMWAFGLTGGGFLERYFNDTVSAGVHLFALGLLPQPVIAIAEERSTALRMQAGATLGLGISF